jgi:hypothetical protein
MRYLQQRPATISSLPVLLLLSGCGGTEAECDSPDTRASVIRTVSDNSDNALVRYAIKASDGLKTKLSAASTEADKSAILEKARKSAVYRLGDFVNTNSKDKRAVTCSGDMSVTVEGVTVQKMVNYRVDQTGDGKLSVSVSPFQFDPAKD